jgi:hypothetical protein
MNSITPTGPATEAKKVLLKDIASKWSKFSEAEIAALTSRDQLLSGVQAKYSLDATQATREVDGLLAGRAF